MLFSIIIPTCNREASIELCLISLCDSLKHIDGTNYEIVISDDGLNNETRDLIQRKFNFVNWVKGPQRGPASNRNNGAKYSNGDWLIFIDDDCIVDERLLISYKNSINNRKPNQFVFEGKIISNHLQKRFDEESPINLTGGCLWSCNFCIKKEIFNSIGKFDENFPYPAMEDVDLNVRLKKFYEVCFVENAIVLHPWRQIHFFKNFSKKLYSQKYFINKHYSHNKLPYRVSRIKIFLFNIFYDFNKLIKFRFKGTLNYIEVCIFNFCTIFL